MSFRMLGRSQPCLMDTKISLWGLIRILLKQIIIYSLHIRLLLLSRLHKVGHVPLAWPCGQYIHPRVCHHHGLLELGGQFSVLSYTGPVVRPCLVPPHPLRYHGFYSEAVTRLHNSHCLVLSIVRNIGSTVKQPK